MSYSLQSFSFNKIIYRHIVSERLAPGCCILTGCVGDTCISRLQTTFYCKRLSAWMTSHSVLFFISCPFWWLDQLMWDYKSVALFCLFPNKLGLVKCKGLYDFRSSVMAASKMTWLCSRHWTAKLHVFLSLLTRKNHFVYLVEEVCLIFQGLWLLSQKPLCIGSSLLSFV